MLEDSKSQLAYQRYVGKSSQMLASETELDRFVEAWKAGRLPNHASASLRRHSRVKTRSSSNSVFAAPRSRPIPFLVSTTS
jgi:hypothetical protein